MMLNTGIKLWRAKMPVETYIAIAASVAAFGTLMAVMAWALWYTRDVTPHF